MVATIVWLVLGLLLCLSEILTPKVLVELPMGVSALVMALLSQLIPQVNLQIFLWLLFSLGFVVLLRHFVPRRQAYTIQDASEAQTLTAIAPGQVGRVIYEGNSWQARCETGVQLGINQQVYVVGRQGNTLLVVPEQEILTLPEV